LNLRAVTADLPDTPASQEAVTVERISYHGWPDCYLLSNGCVEAVVVPAIARVMQLRLAGETEGPFWENRALDGLLHDAAPDEWINFGGDKCWPAPQSAWSRQQGREWPPPVAFDSRPAEAAATEFCVVLTSPIDPGFGIQVARHVELDAGQPVLRIRTEYRKLLGGPVRVGIWTITQLREPERVAVLLAEDSKFASGYLGFLAAQPAELKIDGRFLWLKRHTSEQVKIGTDGSCMVWVGARCALRIDAEAGPGEYPDGGCVTEVYTNPDPLPYVELEVLGPLQAINAGERIERTTLYTLKSRSTSDPEEEARKMLRYL
jgi:hypothetical protein